MISIEILKGFMPVIEILNLYIMTAEICTCFEQETTTNKTPDLTGFKIMLSKMISTYAK
jgi:hypothetical protein